MTVRQSQLHPKSGRGMVPLNSRIIPGQTGITLIIPDRMFACQRTKRFDAPGFPGAQRSPICACISMSPWIHASTSRDIQTTVDPYPISRWITTTKYRQDGNWTLVAPAHDRALPNRIMGTKFRLQIDKNISHEDEGNREAYLEWIHTL